MYLNKEQKAAKAYRMYLEAEGQTHMRQVFKRVSQSKLMLEGLIISRLGRTISDYRVARTPHGYRVFYIKHNNLYIRSAHDVQYYDLSFCKDCYYKYNLAMHIKANKE